MLSVLFFFPAIDTFKPLRLMVPLLALLVVSFSATTGAEEIYPDISERSGYSSLGLGFELLKFEESISLEEQNGSGDTFKIDIESDYSGGNFAQRSWVFVAVNQLWGFYIGSGSTLSSLQHDETWNATVSNSAGDSLYSDLKIQTNTTTLTRNELSVLAVRAITGNHSFVFGARYNSISYKRFDFEAHATDIFTNLNTPDGDISEESTALIGQAGYEYNEFFTSEEAGWRTQFRAVVGIVLYNRVQNTERQIADIIFDDSFNGYDLKATFSFGYQFNKHFMLALALDSHYQSYDEIRQQNASIPDNVFSYTQPSINALWSF